MKVASEEIYSKSIVSLCHFLWRYYCLRLRGVFAYRGYCVICRRQYRSIFIRLAVVASQAPKSAISREITRKFELIAVQVWVSEMWSLTLNILCRTKRIERASNSRLYSILTATLRIIWCLSVARLARFTDERTVNAWSTFQARTTWKQDSGSNHTAAYRTPLLCTNTPGKYGAQWSSTANLTISRLFFDNRHKNVQL